MPKDDAPPLQIIAHRGGLEGGPENTLRAIEFSLDSGVNALEIDVQVSRDGSLYVFHDETVDRLTSSSGFFAYHTDRDIADIDVEGQAIPTLEAVIDTIFAHPASKASGFVLNIEVKSKQAIAPLTSILKERLKDRVFFAPNVMLSSFDQNLLVMLSEKLPAFSRAVCLAGTPVDYAACMDRCKAQALHLCAQFIDGGLVRDAIARGGDVRVYTVNEPLHLKRLQDMGVSGVFTDYPVKLMG